MPYKPTGQMLGNVPASAIDSQTPFNRALVPSGLSISPTAQPTGTSMLAWGEGADSASLNRPLAALARNADYLRAKMAAPIAVARNIDSTGIAAVATATTTDIALTPSTAVFDGWMYTGTVLADIDLYVRLINRDGSEVRNSSGTQLIVSDVRTGAGVSMVGVAQTVASSAAVTQPLGAGVHPRHYIKFATAVLQAQIGAATARGLRVAISGSTATVVSEGTNNGNFVVVNGTGDGAEFTLAEFRYRIRHYSASGTFQVGDALSAPSGATGTVVYVGSDCLEFTDGVGTFLAGEVVTGNLSLKTATISRFTAPGDPVILNNRGAGTVIATFTTDGSWINTAFTSAPKVVMSGSLVATADRLLQIGGLTTLEQLGAGGFLSFGYSSPATDLNKAYEVGRTVTADLGAITLNTATTAEALKIVRTSGTGSVSILEIKDVADTRFAVVFDDAAADQPDYTYAYCLNTDLIRSYSYRKLSTGRTSAINLSTSDGYVALRSGTSGGTEVDVLKARKSSSTETQVIMMGPTGTGLASGQTATFSVTDEMELTLTRSSDTIVWARFSDTQGVLDGGVYTDTDCLQYIGGNHETEGDYTALAVNNSRGASITSTYVRLLCMVVRNCDGLMVVGQAIGHAQGGKGTLSKVDVGYIEVLQLHRLSISGVTGTFAVANTITGSTSGATGTIAATDGATYVEYYPTLLTITAETVTSSAGGSATATVSTGAWTGGTEVITTSSGTGVRDSTYTGRSDTKLAKVSATYNDGNGTALLSVSPAGGFLTGDVDQQHPVMTVPDLAYASDKYLMVDVPLTGLRSQLGYWVPRRYEGGSGAADGPGPVDVPFGMQVRSTTAPDDKAFLSIPPFNAGVCSTVVTMDANSTTARIKITASTGVFTVGHAIAGTTSGAVGVVVASDNTTYIEYTPAGGMFTTESILNVTNGATASGKGIKAGDLVFVDSSLAPVGMVSEIFDNQVRILVVQGCAFAAGTLWRGGPTYSGISTANWKLTTASLFSSLTHYDTKPELVGIEVIVCGDLQAAGVDVAVFSLLKSTLTAISTADTYSLLGTGAFNEKSIFLGADAYTPSTDAAESFVLQISSADPTWHVNAWLHVQKVRAYLSVRVPNPGG